MWLKTDAGTYINIACIEAISNSVYSDESNTVYVLGLKSGNSVTLNIPTKIKEEFDASLERLMIKVYTVSEMAAQTIDNNNTVRL